mmetsp:Transcript_19581/g.44395  ORF Transcript_19581/g.44395 Transcript_19581/m.44395 type:complete len:263 (+) Transcript_19581:1017-1805(+)
MDVCPAKTPGTDADKHGRELLLCGFGAHQNRAAAEVQVRVELVQMIVPACNAPPDTVESLDQAGNSRGLNAVADVGLHTANLQHLLVVCIRTISQSSTTGGSLNGIRNKAAPSVAFHYVHVQRRDARLPASLDENCLLGGSRWGGHSRTLAAVLRCSTDNGAHRRQVIFNLLTVHFLLASDDDGADAFRPHVALRARVESEAAAPRAQEARGSVGRPPGLGQAKVHSDAAGQILNVTRTLLLHRLCSPEDGRQPGCSLRVNC